MKTNPGPNVTKPFTDII